VDMGRPKQLNKQQVETLKKQNNGSPIAVENITVTTGDKFTKEFELRENDVFMLTLTKD